MPAVSESQRRAMYAAAEGRSTLGIPRSVGKEFVGKDAGTKTLYVNRPLKNGAELLAWAKAQGFKSTLPADDLHVTVAFSKKPVDWHAAPESFDSENVPAGGARSIEKLGDAVVLRFQSMDLTKRWQQFRDAGASWDYPGYKPHITISYDAGSIDLAKVKPYTGPLEFGPEKFAEIDLGWKEKAMDRHVTGDSLAFDRDPSNRTVDQDGHLHVARSVMTRAAVNPYYGEEIPNREKLGLDRTKTYHIFRPPEELEKAAASLNGKPLLLRHKAVSSEDHPKSITVGSVFNPEYAGGEITAELTVWDQKDIDAIEDNSKKQLSCGYRYEAIMEPGTFEGQHYDGKMTNILFNHAAIVEEGRVEGAVVGDSASERGWARLGHILEAVLFGGALDREYKRAPDGRFGSVAGSPGTGIISKGSPLAMKEKAAKVAAKAPKAEKKASAPKAAPKEKAPKAEKSKAKKKPGLSKSDWSKYNDYWSKYDTDADKEAIGAPAEKPKAEKKASAPTPRDPLATSLENLQAKTKFDRRTFLAHVVEKISADNAKIARLPKSQQTLPKLIAFYEPKLGKAKLESIALIVANENSVVH